MTRPPARPTSEYLNRPIRTLAEAERDLIRRPLIVIPFLRESTK